MTVGLGCGTAVLDPIDGLALYPVYDCPGCGRAIPQEPHSEDCWLTD